MSRQTRTEWLITLLPVPLLGLFALLYILWPGMYLRVIVEDGPIEYAQAVLWFLTAAFGIVAARRLRQAKQCRTAGFMVLFALAAVFVGGEEISWGQRLCGWRTPEMLLHANLQKETTLHNLVGGQRFTVIASIGIGLFGAGAWLFRGGPRTRPDAVRNFIFPARHCALYFLPIAVFFLTYGRPVAARLYALQPAIVPSIHQEIVELLLVLGILVFALDNAAAAARLVPAAAAPAPTQP